MVLIMATALGSAMKSSLSFDVIGSVVRYCNLSSLLLGWSHHTRATIIRSDNEEGVQ